MVEYLPGPYSVHVGGTDENPIVGVNFGPGLMAFIIIPGVSLPDEAFATARLLSAAPDMYEALKIVDAALERLGIKAPETKAAIAKVEGR